MKKIVSMTMMLAVAGALLAGSLLTGCGSGSSEVQTTASMTTAGADASAAADGSSAVASGGEEVAGAGKAEVAAPGADGMGTAGNQIKAEAPGANAAESKPADPSQITGDASAGTDAGVSGSPADAADEEDVVIRVGAMAGPTAMGMVKLMEDNADGLTLNQYDFLDLATEASAMVGPLSQGTVDIAAIPSNLAATLYNKTGGGIQVLAVNALGVLNLVERGETLKSVNDLAGKKVYATGQSAVPEYVLRYLLKENGIDPDKDLEIQWCADTTEALSYLKEIDGAAAVLPQPFVTAAMAQIEDLRVVQDLNDAWAELDPGCEIVTGVTVVRTEFAKAHPAAVAHFLEEYAESVEYTEDDIESAAELVAKYGIIAKAPLAKKALPGCHIVCITGSDMADTTDGFLQLVFEQNPAAVGGSMPGDDFYYVNP